MQPVRKIPKAKYNPATDNSFVVGATLVLEGMQFYHPVLSAKERGQLAFYGQASQMDAPPIMFKEGSVGYKQFNYVPQMKRNGKIPQEVFD